MTPEEKLRQLVQEGETLRRKAMDTPPVSGRPLPVRWDVSAV